MAFVVSSLKKAPILSPEGPAPGAIAGYAASGNLSKLSQTWAQLPEAQHAAGVPNLPPIE